AGVSAGVDAIGGVGKLWRGEGQRRRAGRVPDAVDDEPGALRVRAEVSADDVRLDPVHPPGLRHERELDEATGARDAKDREAGEWCRPERASYRAPPGVEQILDLLTSVEEGLVRGDRPGGHAAGVHAGCVASRRIEHREVL